MKGWTSLASNFRGEVHTTIDQREGKIRVVIAANYDKIVAIADSLDEAASLANARARQAGIREDHMIQALSIAHSEAVDAMEAE